MELKETIERLKRILLQRDEINKIKDKEEREIEKSAYFEEMPFDEIDTVLKELDKKDKVIDLMADKLFRHGFFVVEPVKKYDVESELYIKSKTKEEIKEYFYKKVEEEKDVCD